MNAHAFAEDQLTRFVVQVLIRLPSAFFPLFSRNFSAGLRMLCRNTGKESDGKECAKDGELHSANSGFGLVVCVNMLRRPSVTSVGLQTPKTRLPLTFKGKAWKAFCNLLAFAYQMSNESLPRMLKFENFPTSSSAKISLRGPSVSHIPHPQGVSMLSTM